MMIADMAAGQVSIQFGARGTMLAQQRPAPLAPIPLAMPSGYSTGDADIMISGGAEALLASWPWAVLPAKTLSTRNDEPERASRPFDAGRRVVMVRAVAS